MENSSEFKWVNGPNSTSVLPPSFVLPEDKRPLLSQVSHLSSIPVIDMADLDTNNFNVVSAVSKACEEYGFFHVVNHGVPLELRRRMLEVVEEFFVLPPEEKADFFSEDVGKQVRLFNRSLKVEGREEKVAMWSEVLYHPWHPALDFTQPLPQNPPQYREVMAEFAREIGGLVKRLLSLISQGLGLDKNYLERKLDKNPRNRAQANYYPPCPDPELTMGLAIHTDLCFLTVLLQSDCVTGLHVLKDDQWVVVDPMPNSFIINLGDQLQVMSNGRYKSVHHRAVTNKQKRRVSLAMFYGPNEDTIIGPIDNLIDEEHPPKYRSYCYKEFIEEFNRQEGTRRRVKEVFEIHPSK